MDFTSSSIRALKGVAVSLSLALLPMAASAQVAVVVPQASLDAAFAQCTDEASCLVAIEALIAELIAANPGVPEAEIIGSVATAVASAYNDGDLSPEVAQVVLASVGTAASERGLTELAASISTSIEAVVAGEPIDLEAVAEGSASET